LPKCAVVNLGHVPEEANMLTGRFDFRKTLSGRLVLLIEEDVRAFWSPFRKRVARRRWRKARVIDLASPELRPLIDLRSKPNYLPPSARIEEAPQPESQESAPKARSHEPAPPAAVLASEPNGEARVSTH
jgi:hypothetical protein